MATIMSWFKSFCNLPNVRGAINGTHFSMAKPIRPFNKNYYYHRIGGYNIVCQIVIDKKETFFDIFWDYSIMSTIHKSF
jgi:mRNA-degrading endonuclease RelE of RelBE toxin-antitoxin system